MTSAGVSEPTLPDTCIHTVLVGVVWSEADRPAISISDELRCPGGNEIHSSPLPWRLPARRTAHLLYCRQELGVPSTTAQVHPRLLTTALVEAAAAKGARLVKARVSGLRLAEDGGSLTGEMLPRPSEWPNRALALAEGDLPLALAAADLDCCC